MAQDLAKLILLQQLSFLLEVMLQDWPPRHQLLLKPFNSSFYFYPDSLLKSCLSLQQEVLQPQLRLSFPHQLTLVLGQRSL